MDIIEVVGQVRELLQQQGRLSYRIVCRQFALDEAALDDLKFELIDIQEVAVDKDGKMLVWTGGGRKRGIGETGKWRRRRGQCSIARCECPTPRR